jgi:Fe-S-cluster containining protein
MSTYRNAKANTTLTNESDKLKALLGELRKEIVGGLQYTHSRANANTTRTLETATFLYALIEVLTEKGVLTIEELDGRKDKIADRVERRFVSEGMGVVLQEPDQDKYGFEAEAHVDCENRVHLCKAACCRMMFPLSRQDIAERIIMWDLESPYLIAQTEEGYCRHLDRTDCRCTVREHRPIPCRAYDCRNDSRIWSDFANYVINPDLETLFRKRESVSPEPIETPNYTDLINC